MLWALKYGPCAPTSCSDSADELDGDKIQASVWTFEILESLGEDSLWFLRESVSIHSTLNSKVQTLLKKLFFNVQGINNHSRLFHLQNHSALQGCR